MSINLLKWMYFRINEFKVRVYDSIFSGNEQLKMYNVLDHSGLTNTLCYYSMVAQNYIQFFLKELINYENFLKFLWKRFRKFI